MAESFNVLAAEATATGAITTSRCRLRGIHYTGAVGGDAAISLTDGSGGTERFPLTALTDQVEYIDIPADGILFKNGIYVATLTNVAAITVFYDG